LFLRTELRHTEPTPTKFRLFSRYYFTLPPFTELYKQRFAPFASRKFQVLSESNRTIAPWTLVRSDNNKLARINCIKYLLTHMQYAEKLPDKELAYDPDIIVTGIDAEAHGRKSHEASQSIWLKMYKCTIDPARFVFDFQLIWTTVC